MRIDPKTFSFKNPKGFLVLEGVNGAGKSTLIDMSMNFLKEKKLLALRTFEPGGTELGKTLRTILLGSEHNRPTPLSEVFLFAADRSHHVSTVIQPALRAGTKVISDRFYYSTLAFQGYGRELSRTDLLTINKIAIQNTYPDLVIVLDLDPAVGLARTKKRAEQSDAAGKDAFESEELEFHKRLRHGFLELADSLPEPFLVLDASKPSAEVFAELKPVLEKWVMR